MKKAWRWLLVGATVALPTVALAQRPGAGAPARPGGAPPAASTGQTPISVDDDDPPGSTSSTAPGTRPPDDGRRGICKIQPDAPGCQGAASFDKDAKRDLNAEIYALQQIYALRYRRFEIQPYWSFTLNDQFVNHPAPGLASNFYITNVLAVGLNFNWYGGLNVDSDFNFQNRRATRVAVPLNEYQWSAAANVSYVPIYGKFAGFGDFIFHYDAYVVGGAGVISTRPIPVFDPDNRNFDFKPKLAFNVGLGLRIFINRWLAATLEIRDYIYSEELENLTVKPTGVPGCKGCAQDKSTWYRETGVITNNVQAQIGVSVFLPFSWKYELRK